MDASVLVGRVYTRLQPGVRRGVRAARHVVEANRTALRMRQAALSAPHTRIWKQQLLAGWIDRGVSDTRRPLGACMAAHVTSTSWMLFLAHGAGHVRTATCRLLEASNQAYIHQIATAMRSVRQD